MKSDAVDSGISPMNTGAALPPHGGRGRHVVKDYGPPDRRLSVTRAQLLMLRALVVVLMILAWQASATWLKTDNYTSSPTAVLGTLRTWSDNGVLWQSTWTTLQETLLGFVIGLAAGAVVGLILGWSRRLGAVFEPFIMLLYAAPKLAVAPLFVLWFGIGISSKSLFAAMIVFFLVFFTTFQGARQVDRELIQVSRVLGARPSDVWLKVALPQAMVWLFAGVRISLPYGLIGAVVAEFLAATSGLGYLVRNSSSSFDTAGVYAGVVALMILATIMLQSTQALERWVLRWRLDHERDIESGT
jgi:NitT/TauT family transport system permease protein